MDNNKVEVISGTISTVLFILLFLFTSFHAYLAPLFYERIHHLGWNGIVLEKGSPSFSPSFFPLILQQGN